MDSKFSILILLVVAALVIPVRPDDDVEDGGLAEVRKNLEDSLGESVKGVGEWLKDVAGEAKDKAEDGMDSLKTFSEGAKKMSSAGAETAKGWAASLGESFEKAKDKVQETGGVMREAMGDVAVNTKEEIETAASKVSKHAKEAGEAVFKLFG